jgi:hypothetical protein
VGFIDPDELLEMMDFAFCRYGATHFVIDFLMRISGLEENAPAQGDFMKMFPDGTTTAKHGAELREIPGDPPKGEKLPDLIYPRFVH